MPQQFFLQHAAGLNEQAAIDCFVRHPHRVLIGECPFEPPRNLFRRPLAHQFPCDDSLERAVGCKPTEFRAPGMRPSPRIGGGGAIPTEPTMAFDFPTDCRGRTTERGGDLPD